MYFNLNDAQNRILFTDVLLELITKRQDILEEVINKILQRKAEQELANNVSVLSKKQRARIYFENLNLDFSAYEFNREQANER